MANSSCCYTLVIRQVTCQNGIRRVINNVYNNVEDGTVITLSFGYRLTIISRTTSDISVRLENPNYIPSIIFTIPVDSFKEFNVPKESGTLIIFIGVKATACPTIQCCQETT